MIFKKFPTEQQFDKMDCGAACLKIIAKYHGRFYSLQYIRELCGTTKEGVSISNICHGAEIIGLRTRPFKCTNTVLLRQIPVPCILHWNNNHFLQTGEPVFSIVPAHTKILAQVVMPAAGAGKVTMGQEVIIKLDDYPYNEYGSLNGTVKNISLISNSITTQEGTIENYLITVDMPDQLLTNFGKQLVFKYEIKGIAEIITNDRRLIQRFFDNLNYLFTK